MNIFSTLPLSIEYGLHELDFGGEYELIFSPCDSENSMIEIFDVVNSLVLFFFYFVVNIIKYLEQEGGRKPWNSINFVCAHDGFTLADLVTYNNKHNLANGENNNDGESHNNSWNCGQVYVHNPFTLC